MKKEKPLGAQVGDEKEHKLDKSIMADCDYCGGWERCEYMTEQEYITFEPSKNIVKYKFKCKGCKVLEGI